MDELIVTCAQQQVRIFESHHQFRSDVQRFMRQAKIKESHLVIFPELSGLLLVPPLAPGLKRTLLKMAERQVKRSPSLLDRMIGRAADSAVGAIGGIGKDIANTILQHESTLRDSYLTIFSETAREYSMYIVGGSIYLPDAVDGQIHNTAFLFGPTGDIIGWQAKVVLNTSDKQFCQPTQDGWKTLATDFGALGILIGEDVLYPESGRILAERGALAVVNLVATSSHSTFLKARHALAARLEENMLLGAQSCLVGKNILGLNEPDFVGRSTIFAPIEMTSRYAGVLGEVGSMVTESVVSSTWDIKGLLELRQTTRTPTHIIPDDRTLRDQIRQVYGLVEEIQPSPAFFPATPTEEVQALPIQPVPAAPEEWREWATATEEESQVGKLAAGEVETEPAGEGQAEAPLIGDFDEAGAEDVGQQPFYEPFPEERAEFLVVTADEGAASEETTNAFWRMPSDTEDAESDEFYEFPASVPTETEVTVSPEAEAEQLDSGLLNRVWDDSEDSSDSDGSTCGDESPNEARGARPEY